MSSVALNPTRRSETQKELSLIVSTVTVTSLSSDFGNKSQGQSVTFFFCKAQVVISNRNA